MPAVRAGFRGEVLELVLDEKVLARGEVGAGRPFPDSSSMQTLTCQDRWPSWIPVT